MAQLTLYVNPQTLKKIETAAKREHLSLSKWVQKRLENAWRTDWPGGYFDLFGALADVRLERPSQGDFSQDIRRQKL